MSALARLLLLVPELKEKSPTPGDLYNWRLAQGLGAQWDLVVRDFRSLPGFAREEGAYALAIERVFAADGPFDAVVQDTYVYPFAKRANEWMAARAPVIGLTHTLPGEQFSRPWHRWRHDREMAIAMRPYAGLVVVNDELRQHALYLKFAADRIAVVLPGNEVATYRPSSTRRPSPIRIVGVGTYRPELGQLPLVRGMTEALRHNPGLLGRVRLDLYGNQRTAPEYVQQIRQAVLQAGLVDSVGIHGPVDRTDLWEIFAQSHLVADLGAEVAGTTLEAMRCGVVPLLRDGSAGRDLRAGAMTAPEPLGLANAITKLSENPDELAALSRAAVRRSYDLVMSWDTTLHTFTAAVNRLRTHSDHATKPLLA